MGAYYNPPGPDCGSLNQLRGPLASIPSSSQVVLCGDFDLPCINWDGGSPIPSVHSRNATLMCDIVNDFNLTQLVLKPTRQQSILDLAYTNRVDVVHKVEVAAGLLGSDHDAVHFTTNFHTTRITLQKRWSYKFKKADFKTLHKLLNRVPWDSCFLSESV